MGPKHKNSYFPLTIHLYARATSILASYRPARQRRSASAELASISQNLDSIDLDLDSPKTTSDRVPISIYRAASISSFALSDPSIDAVIDMQIGIYRVHQFRKYRLPSATQMTTPKTS